MAKINLRGLRKEIGAQYSVKFQKAAAISILNEFERAKQKMMSEFEQHKVTQQISAGPSASNLSNGGSLFSLLGFENGADPIEVLRVFLDKHISLKVKKASSKEVAFYLNLKIPNKSQIRGASPLPWAPGVSWVEEIENGISGLGQFLVKETPASRSGGGIQVHGTVGGNASLGGTPYISQILINLLHNITDALGIKPPLNESSI